jgi:flagellar biosynthesis/type III secretory pathway M-ring protein FliF/YscJ
LALVLSFMVLAVVALALGAFFLWRRGGSRKQVALMLVLALVIAGNVALLTWPDASGKAPIARELR